MIGPPCNKAPEYAGIFYDNEISNNIADCPKMLLCNLFRVPLTSFAMIQANNVPFMAKLAVKGKLITSIGKNYFK